MGSDPSKTFKDIMIRQWGRRRGQRQRQYCPSGPPAHLVIACLSGRHSHVPGKTKLLGKPTGSTDREKHVSLLCMCTLWGRVRVYSSQGARLARAYLFPEPKYCLFLSMGCEFLFSAATVPMAGKQ